ncbi:hypothetical protein CANINC_001963 [Pichia inconspicua]|uniref:Armadillo repeat-containing protein 8 n=1 Tax=Pichia inconspicua TaxID=52247 RepID=A0A4T0X2T6_9ASCO|nr:hypothetical protein CANINC_001963 [[Candida] inconspicua]
MFELQTDSNLSANLSQKINQILKKYSLDVSNSSAVEKIALFPKLLQLIRESEVNKSDIYHLQEIFEKWNFTDDIVEMKYVLELLVLLNDSNLNHCYIKKVVEYIEKYDLSELVLSETMHVSEFLNEIIKATELYLPDYVYHYAMHLQIKASDPQFTRLDTLQINLQQSIDFDELFQHGVEKNYCSSNIHHNNSITVESQLSAISSRLEKELFATAAIFINKQQNSKYLQDNYIAYLITIASSDVSYLSWSAISVLYKLGITHNRFDLLELIFPVLISMAVIPFESKQVLEKYTRTHHLPLDLLPISMIAGCVQKNTMLVKHLHDINMIQKIEDWYLDFNISKGYISRFDSVCFSNYLIILSNMVSHDDKIKSTISNSKMNELIILVLKKHSEILQLWTSMYDETLYRKAFLLSIQTTLATCTLLRALSRSPSFLRTFFIKNKYIELLSQILCINFEQLNVASFGDYFLEKEMELETVVLGTLSNLVIEFLPNQEVLNVPQILKVVNRYLDGNSVQPSRLISALSFIRNGLFGNDSIFFTQFKDTIGVCRIFTMCDHQDVNIQIQAFNIIRNLLTTKTAITHHNYVYEMFKQYSDDSTLDFVEFVRMHLNRSRDLTLTTTLCYTLVHFSSSNTENKVTMIKNKGLMKNLLDILHMKQRTDDDPESFWKIKTCIAWIIINLTTADTDGDNNFTDRIITDEDYKLLQTKERSSLLIDMGFHETLKMLPQDCPSVDFIERASRAVFQLLVSCNNN